MRSMEWRNWRRVGLVLLSLAIWAVPLVSSAASDDEMLRNVALVLIPREILFFSAQAGQWTAVRLEAGESILQRGVDGNVAAAVTSQRAVGFSAALNVAQELRVSQKETLESFKVEGTSLLSCRATVRAFTERGPSSIFNRQVNLESPRRREQEVSVLDHAGTLRPSLLRLLSSMPSYGLLKRPMLCASISTWSPASAAVSARMPVPVDGPPAGRDCLEGHGTRASTVAAAARCSCLAEDHPRPEGAADP
jgi:hypothetical protein